MASGLFDSNLVKGTNTVVQRLLKLPAVRSILGRRLVTISYVGRRSGRRFSTPVVIRGDGEVLTIPVVMSESKTWWRNFEGEGRPITVHLASGDLEGHAVAGRDARGRMCVTVNVEKAGA